MRIRRHAVVFVVFALAAGLTAALGMHWRGHNAAGSPIFQSADLVRGDIYPDGAQAPLDLRNALARAAREHKHVILDFGGNWCPDCHVLAIYFHDPENLKLLNANYVLVSINIGRYDQNLGIAAKYGIPIHKGVPALAVLDSRGRVLYSQRNGEFENMRKLDSASVTTFLNEWKP